VARKKPTSGAGRSPKRSTESSLRKKKAPRVSAGGARVKPGKSAAPVGASEPPRLKKTPLSKKVLEEFRELLLAKRHELLGDMSGMEEQSVRQQSSGNLSSMPTHMADVGTDNFEHEFTLGLLESEQQLLREIDEALRRIEEKTYGICVGTGQPIPEPRLRAKPWAKYTVEYTRMVEKGLVKPPEAEPEEHDEVQEDQEEEPEGEEEETYPPEADAAEEGSNLYEEEQEEA